MKFNFVGEIVTIKKYKFSLKTAKLLSKEIKFVVFKVNYAAK